MNHLFISFACFSINNLIFVRYIYYLNKYVKISQYDGGFIKLSWSINFCFMYFISSLWLFFHYGLFILLLCSDFFIPNGISYILLLCYTSFLMVFVWCVFFHSFIVSISVFLCFRCLFFNSIKLGFLFYPLCCSLLIRAFSHLYLLYYWCILIHFYFLCSFFFNKGPLVVNSQSLIFQSVFFFLP